MKTTCSLKLLLQDKALYLSLLIGSYLFGGSTFLASGFSCDEVLDSLIPYNLHFDKAAISLTLKQAKLQGERLNLI